MRQTIFNEIVGKCSCILVESVKTSTSCKPEIARAVFMDGFHKIIAQAGAIVRVMLKMLPLLILFSELGKSMGTDWHITRIWVGWVSALVNHGS